MNRKIFLPLIAFALLLAACGRRESTSAELQKNLYTPEYASGFVIRGADGAASTILEVRNPWQGADSIVSRLFIERGGEKAPDGFDGQVLCGEARRIVTMSSSHVAMLGALGASSSVVGVSGIGFISDPAIQARRDSVGDIGFEGNIDYELLLSLNPDIVLLYALNGASTMESKLSELGIPYLYVGDYLEESPLGKAEWLVAISEILGCRKRGEEVFAGIPQRYNAIRKKVADAALPAPKVMLNSPYGDSWMMPSADNYSVRLITDAGGEYVYRKNKGNSSVAIDTEEAYLLASAADVWINVGQARSLAELARMCPKFTDTPVFRAGKVYNNNRRTTPAGGNDFWESSIVNPDLALRDLVKIFHPELVEEDFIYYKRLE